MLPTKYDDLEYGSQKMDHLKKDDIVSSEEIKVLVVKRKNGREDTYVKVDDTKKNPYVVGMDHARGSDFSGLVIGTQRDRAENYWGGHNLFGQSCELTFTHTPNPSGAFVLGRVRNKLTFDELEVGTRFKNRSGVDKFVKLKPFDERGTERNALKIDDGTYWTVGPLTEVTRV